MQPRILVYDIENMGICGWTWGIYEQNVIHVEHDQHLLCLAYKWLGESKVHTIALPDFKLYKKEPHNDLELAKKFWDVLDEADIVIGHNSKSFDDKMVMSMFMRHKIPPPSPFAQVDTKQGARVGRFASNKLDDLGETFGIGKKMKHDGFDLWLGCDRGDPKSWKKMLAYNKQDVKLTERLYLELRPYMKNHPAVNVMKQERDACPKCGAKAMYLGMKYRASNTNLYQYARCGECGGTAKNRIPEPIAKEEKMRFTNG